MVKFWHELSVFTLGGVGYKFGLSLEWRSFGMRVQYIKQQNSTLPVGDVFRCGIFRGMSTV